MNYNKLILKIAHVINTMTFEDLDNILIDEYSQEKILVYNISYKNLIGTKPL